MVLFHSKCNGNYSWYGWISIDYCVCCWWAHGVSAGIVVFTFTRTESLSNLSRASRKHATHESMFVPLTSFVPFTPLIPFAPDAPGWPFAPARPCSPGVPCLFLQLSLSSFLSSNLNLQNSTELTKNPSNGPVLHSYFLY